MPSAARNPATNWGDRDISAINRAHARASSSSAASPERRYSCMRFSNATAFADGMEPSYHFFRTGRSTAVSGIVKNPPFFASRKCRRNVVLNSIASLRYAISRLPGRARYTQKPGIRNRRRKLGSRFLRHNNGAEGPLCHHADAGI